MNLGSVSGQRCSHVIWGCEKMSNDHEIWAFQEIIPSLPNYDLLSALYFLSLSL